MQTQTLIITTHFLGTMAIIITIPATITTITDLTSVLAAITTTITTIAPTAPTTPTMHLEIIVYGPVLPTTITQIAKWVQRDTIFSHSKKCKAKITTNKHFIINIYALSNNFAIVRLKNYGWKIYLISQLGQILQIAATTTKIQVPYGTVTITITIVATVIIYGILILPTVPAPTTILLVLTSHLASVTIPTMQIAQTQIRH